MNVPIRLFYHVCLINHWRDIVEEQLRTVVESGLYNDTTMVYVGSIGNIDEFFAMQEIFKKHQVYRVEFYRNDDIKQYEFFTLKILRKVCFEHEKFYGAYIMTKGVSYGPDKPEKAGGDFWRKYMMDYVVKRWRNNYKALDMKEFGYDLCGVKVIPKRLSPSNTTHISGNMYMFNSEYIKSLCPIESLNTENRFEAETVWLSSGCPIIYVPCNLFVDYFNRDDYDTFMHNFKQLPQYSL